MLRNMKVKDLQAPGAVLQSKPRKEYLNDIFQVIFKRCRRECGNFSMF